jgi:hypothetical protein
MIQAGTQRNSEKSSLRYSFVSRSDAWRSTFAIACFAAAVCLVFWSHISGSAVFIGESDRLNSYLNIRLAEYDALKEYGRIPAWNSTMFGGFSMAALHWMNPGKDPVRYLLQFVSREDVFRSLGYLSIFMVFAACVTAFLYIRDVTRDISSAAVGALSYGLSVFSLHRAAQVDNAHLTVVLIPFALLAIRRAVPDNLAKPFLGLAIAMALLAFWGFLQEVAYAFIFFGCYALYRAGVSKRNGHWDGLAPLVVMAAASTLALLFAAPRLITVAGDFSMSGRGLTFRDNNYSQVLRFFHEGIYGRYFEEGKWLGHSINLHEGLQLVSSAMLSLFVCFGVGRPNSRAETFAAITFFALLAAIFPTFSPFYDFTNEWLQMSAELFRVLAYGAVCAILIVVLQRWRMSRRAIPVRRPVDTTFHLFALSVVLFLVLVPEANDAVYTLFGGIDFTHTRLSILLILPLCTLFSIYLAELKGSVVESAGPKSIRRYAAPAAVVVLSAIAAYVSQSSFLETWIPQDAFELFALHDIQRLMPPVVVSIGLIVLLLSVLMVGVATAGAKMPSIRRSGSIAVAVFVIVETFGYVRLKMEGPQTWTYPVPFREFNYMNVERPVLRPPAESKWKDLQQKLETDSYRSVMLSDTGYSGTKISHLAEFWRLRTIGGYSAGGSDRLFGLSWPKGVRSPRTIDFSSIRDLDRSAFALLAFLNVKYLVALTPDIYFNVSSVPEKEGARAIKIGDVDYPMRIVDVEGTAFPVLDNPVTVLPRHFLVEQVVNVSEPPVPLARAETVLSSTQQWVRTLENQTDDFRKTALVENFGPAGTRTFDNSGEIWVFHGADIVNIRVTPSARERFVVLNESYHPSWRVYVGETNIPLFPVNRVMQGFAVPPHAEHIQLRFAPFSSRIRAYAIMLLALVGLFAGAILLRKLQFRRFFGQ